MSQDFSVTLTHKDAYRFEVEFTDSGFTDFGPFLSDEPEPLGTNLGPSPVHMLIAAVANCLSASFMIAVNRASQDVGGMVTKATARIGRNEDRHFRVASIDVEIQVKRDAADIAEIEDIISRFTRISTVALSVFEGIPIVATVTDTSGRPLREGSIKKA